MGTLTELKQHLRKKTTRELVDEIAYLYKTFPIVKDYYQGTFFMSDEDVALKYKKAIKKQIFPDSGFPKLNLAQAKKELSQFKKISANPESVVDIMAYYIEQGILCTLEYGDMYETFYISMETVYENALKFAKKHNLLDQVKDRFKKMVTDTRNCGWGFHDQLSDVFEQIYSED